MSVPTSVKLGEINYTFLSGVVHLGPNRGNGHYISVASCPDGFMTMFNDEQVEIIVCFAKVAFR